MFLSRNINRLPFNRCLELRHVYKKSFCRTLLTDGKTFVKANPTPILSVLTSSQTNETPNRNKFASHKMPLDLGFLDTHRGIMRREIIDIPLVPNKIIENPVSIIAEIDEINQRIQDIRLPDVARRNTDDQGMRAEVKKNNRPLGMMIIRRKKMKKHKRRKLWKRMRFEWAKRKQRREFRKEKTFQAELLAQIKEAEKFSAEEYVAEKIKQATDVPLPRYWKGKRLPAFIIKDLIEEEQLKKQKCEEKKERFEKYRHMKL